MATRRERAYLGSAALLTAATFLFSLLWAFALPHFEGPDEREHYNSVARLVDGGGWPLPYEASLLGSTWRALGESGAVMPDGEFVDPLPAPSGRGDFIDPSVPPMRSNDGMVQHPPGYYLVAAAVVHTTGGEGMRWDHTAFVLYALSAAMVAGATPFIAGVVRRATGSRWAGILGALFPLFIPWYAASGSRISNDALLILAVSATIYALVRAVTDPRHRTGMLVFSGVAYGVALFAKGYALMLAPVVLLLAVWAVWRRGWGLWSATWRLLLPAGIAAAIGGWWWIRNLILLGRIQPSRFGLRDDRGQEVAADGYSLSLFVKTFFARLNATFWDRIGYVRADGQGWIVGAGGIFLVLVIVLALVLARRRLLLAILLLYPVVILVTLFQNSHAIYWDLGSLRRGIQGRYLFSGIAVFALAFAMLAHRLAHRASRRVNGAVTIIGGVVAMVVVGVAMRSAVPLTWRAREEGTPASISDPAAFMDISPVLLRTMFAAACVLLLLGVVFGARSADSPREREGGRAGRGRRTHPALRGSHAPRAQPGNIQSGGHVRP
ncbi:glycosyltransferase family 39 protein [Microbacterium sp. gxy059]